MITPNIFCCILPVMLKKSGLDRDYWPWLECLTSGHHLM